MPTPPAPKVVFFVFPLYRGGQYVLFASPPPLPRAPRRLSLYASRAVLHTCSFARHPRARPPCAPQCAPHSVPRRPREAAAWGTFPGHFHEQLGPRPLQPPPGPRQDHARDRNDKRGGVRRPTRCAKLKAAKRRQKAGAAGQPSSLAAAATSSGREGKVASSTQSNAEIQQAEKFKTKKRQIQFFPHFSSVFHFTVALSHLLF